MASGSSFPATAFKTKTQLAVEGLQEAIFLGVLKPGARVTLGELASLLGMSITPVREALRIIEGAGLITNEPHRGMTVNLLTDEDIVEISLLRAPMESLATRLAVERITDGELASLEALSSVIADAVASGDDASLTQANASWHFQIYDAAHTKHIIRHITTLWKPFYAVGFWTPDQRSRTLHDHDRIMRAIRSGDADLASSLMFDHVRTAHLSIMKLLRGSGQYNDDGHETAAGKGGSQGVSAPVGTFIPVKYL